MFKKPVRIHLNGLFGNYMVTSMYGLCLLIAIKDSCIHPLQAIGIHIVHFGYIHWIYPCTLDMSLDISTKLWTYPRTHPAASGHVQGYIHKTMDIASGHIQRPSGHIPGYVHKNMDMSTRTYPGPRDMSRYISTIHGYVLVDMSSGLWTYCLDMSKYNPTDMSNWVGHSPSLWTYPYYPVGYDKTIGCIQLLQLLLAWIYPPGWTCPEPKWTLPPLVLSYCEYH